MLRLRLFTAAFGALALVACDGATTGEDAGPMPGTDAGPVADAGPLGTDAGPPAPRAPDGVYTMSNDPAGNEILTFARAADGSLTEGPSYATGGAGSGAGLGSQNGLFFDAAQSRFFAVNAGDDTISMLRLEEDGTITPESTVSANGVGPVSVTARGDVAYVANRGDDMTPANISGFRISGGALEPIDGSSRPLSADMVGPGQIELAADGSYLVVTEKATNRIDLFTVDAAGVASGPIVHPSAGMTPFGFAMTDDGALIVSEAFGGMDGLGATSSYEVGTGSAGLSALSGSVANSQSAPCWVVVVGDYFYVTNTRSDTVTGYDLRPDGTFDLGWSAPTGDRPLDAAATDDGALLYVLNGGDASLSIYDIDSSNGTLSAQPDFTGLPATAVGLATGPSSVYTMSNEPAGNRVHRYIRAANGSLSPAGSTATGGAGSGGGLGSQGGLVINETGTRLFAVNAGDDTVSMFSIATDGSLTLEATVSSGGVSPRSVAVDRDLTYVVNAGSDSVPANISGFRIDGGDLTPLAGSSRPLSADAPGPGQIGFAADADLLVVTEKGTDRITLYELDRGLPSGPVAHPSIGMTPFGFDLTGDGELVVSEAFGGMDDMGAASSYAFTSAGTLRAISESVPSSQSAPCWVARAGDYAYVTNTRSDNLSAYEIAADGSVSLLWSAATGSKPLDASVSEDGAFLYVLNGGSDSLSIYGIDSTSGALMEQSELTGLPETAVGLIAR